MTTILLLLAAGLMALSACSGGNDSGASIPSLDRPADIAIVSRPYTPDEDDLTDAARIGSGYVAACLAADHRLHAYVPDSATGVLGLFDLCRGRLVDQERNPFLVSNLPVCSIPVAVAASPAGERLFVACRGDGRVVAISTQDHNPAGSFVFPAAERPFDLVVSGSSENDFSVVVAVSGSSRVAVLDPTLAKAVWIETGIDGFEAGRADVDPASGRVLIANQGGSRFATVDPRALSATSHDIHAPTAAVSVSPDGAWAYLPLRHSGFVAVWDVRAGRHVDVNRSLPGHELLEAPVGTGAFDLSFPVPVRDVVFAWAGKLPDGAPDGDADVEAEADGDEYEGEDWDRISADEEAGSESTDPSETDEPTDGDTDGDAEPEVTDPGDDLTLVPDPEPRWYGYVVRVDGLVEVVDTGRDHAIWDSLLKTCSVTGEDGTVEVARETESCFSAPVGEKVDGSTLFPARTFYTVDGIAPDGSWELLYNGVVPGTAEAVGGRLDHAASTLTDLRLDFPALGIRPRGQDQRGDYVVFVSSPLAECPYSSPDQYRMEVVEVGEHTLRFDNGEGIRLDRCFNSSVVYSIRANENYLVLFTPSGGSEAVYRGRAFHVPFEQEGGIDVCRDTLPSYDGGGVRFSICSSRDPDPPREAPADYYRWTFTTSSGVDRVRLSAGRMGARGAFAPEYGRLYVIDPSGGSIGVIDPAGDTVDGFIY